MINGREAQAGEAIAQLDKPQDHYGIRDGLLVHELAVGDIRIEATMPMTVSNADPKGSWWLGYLAGVSPEARERAGGRLRTVDLFCGPGGLANGLRQLCLEMGVSLVSDFIADQDEKATLVYSANHASRKRCSASVTKLVDYRVRRTATGATFVYEPELLDGHLNATLCGVDLVLAGPPCQGHSNLNNQTRRSDPRNSLYLTVPAFAVAAGVPICIIENVPAILNDADRVVETARQLFEAEGYNVTTGILSASSMGWPQTRKRHFLIARRDRPPVPLVEISQILRDEPRSLWWAIGDLEDDVGDTVMSQVTELSEENQARIDWLFDNDAYELALRERPESHRAGTTYTSVYGRLKRDQPGPTITTGFMTPGRGRYTHPTRRRVLTAHEAARLQGFPDTYRFVPDLTNPPSRSQLAKWIGDAVPMPLGYAAALSAFGGGMPGG